MGAKSQRDLELEASSAEILRLRRCLTADRATFQEIIRLARSTTPNKQEIEQHAIDSVAAIERSLLPPKQTQ